MNSHHKGKKVMRPSYLCYRNYSISKTAFRNTARNIGESIMFIACTFYRIY